MTKLQTLMKHAQEIQNKISDSTPKKHQSHPETYKRFLKNELEMTQKKIEQLKMEGSKK